MRTPAPDPVSGPLGIVGGLGPLASAELVQTIYRLNLAAREQDAPACILLSDPSFPDRTEAILRGDTAALAARLTHALARLVDAGAGRLLIACVTVHHVLPEVPAALSRRLISLVDLTIEEMLREPRPRLLLASAGTRASRLFERHPRWDEAEPWVRSPAPAEQQELHEWLYRLKAHAPPAACLEWIEGLAASHGVEGLIFACTELHLLQRTVERQREERGSALRDSSIVDPLWVAARDFARLVTAPVPPLTPNRPAAAAAR